MKKLTLKKEVIEALSVSETKQLKGGLYSEWPCESVNDATCVDNLCHSAQNTACTASVPDASCNPPCKDIDVSSGCNRTWYSCFYTC